MMFIKLKNIVAVLAITATSSASAGVILDWEGTGVDFYSSWIGDTLRIEIDADSPAGGWANAVAIDSIAINDAGSWVNLGDITLTAVGFDSQMDGSGLNAGGCQAMVLGGNHQCWSGYQTLADNMIFDFAFSVGGEQKSAAIFRHFAVTLLPIAIAYHLSHYASFLLYAGQLAIPLMSDPFGLGWDLFGTKGYVVDVGVAGAKDIWYLSLIAIVAGHVFAVVLGHVEALRLFSSRSLAVRSQIPLLILMVLFTFTSLWILAQPVIAS